MSRLVQNVFDTHKNWVTQFEIDGQTYGGEYCAYKDPRVQQFWEYFPDAKKVLELGCLEAGHTIQLADRVDVTAIEGKTENFDKAWEIVRLHSLKNKVELIQANLETYDLASMGKFDAIFCLGLLYHLGEPQKLLAQFNEMTDGIFLWTHCCNPKNVNTEVGGFQGRIYEEPSTTGPLTGMSNTSFWPTIQELSRMFTELGYYKLEIIHLESDEMGDFRVTMSVKRS